MSWDQGAKEAAGGDYLSVPIGVTVKVQIAGMYQFTDVEFDDGVQTMCQIPVINLDAPSDDGEPVILSMGKRRSHPLLALCGELQAKKSDPTTRAIQIECKGIKHPTKVGKQIGKIICTDLGPASEHGGVNVWSAGAADADADADPATTAMAAMASAADVDALKAAFAAGWKSTSDLSIRATLKAAYEDLKVAIEGGEDIPF